MTSSDQVRTGQQRLVDAVCVLSVRSFADRIAFMREQLARHGIEFRFVFEHDRDESIVMAMACAQFATHRLQFVA